jgi:uncharacterized protein (DUF736 family)
MSIIGTFTKTADGAYTGAINTLSLNIKAVQFRPIEATDKNAPSFRIMAGAAELGAAWSKRTADDRAYLSVKLDDPSFRKEVFGALLEAEEGYHLVWSRPRKRTVKK